MAACRTCEAPIVWVESQSTGKPMPMDLAPDPKGGFVIIGGKARKATADDDRLARERFTSHFATCPDANQWRSAR